MPNPPADTVRSSVLSDSEVVSRVLDGETALFEVLMRRHNQRVYRAARAIVRDDREAIAAKICTERGAVLVKPYDDAGIMAGQGTAGLEIAEDAARFSVTLDEVLTPCSGGGLVSGVALALKGSGVTAKVHSVEPENFDGMKRSLEAHARVTAPGGALSIADALMAPIPGSIVFELAKDLLARWETLPAQAKRPL